MIRFLLSLLLAQQIAAFAPHSSTFSPATSVKGAHPPTAATMKPYLILRMSEGDNESSSSETPAKPVVSADGTFYDDELDSAPVKTGISNSMRDRLISEASTGLDSEKKQTNVILYISVAVAILVVLGGQGIFF